MTEDKIAAKKAARGRLKRALAKTAPEIAEALGGPLAGKAVEKLSQVIFGDSGKNEQAIEAALKTATLDQLLAIRRADNEFRIALRNAEVEELRIDAADRASARQRQTALDDWTPAMLGGAIVLGFFIVLGVMVARRLPDGAETEFSIMLGALATMTAAVVNYYFGSSAGSREKTRLLMDAPRDGETK